MIEYFKVNELSIPVRLNRKAIILFEKKYNKGLSSLQDIGTEELSMLLFLGVCEGHKFLDIQNEYAKFEDFETMLDEMDISEFYEVAGKVIGSFFSKKKK
ncbi:hypothetical protein P872_18505 [Rhodonellum psychrophilum GCM71 = DSM 17998]|uniref:Uncharacterized protein n=2 Tax=Rhodonellum TaxID=336827 RepID=U5BX16_9BACT|nr:MULTISPECIES: hypothetical protein [Rhodonellum]ERM82388.1 hypothetical protein P872_18505 [Rhodonellum psychrophilum GCM71 = DSM 17998]SDZ35690.1 hypothetical protein SAMN05444412_11157 [Rhodonellum ikkaensis]